MTDYSALMARKRIKQPNVDPAKLARVWADAAPLSSYITSRANEVLAQSKSANRSPDSSSAMERTARTLEFHMNRQIAMEKAKAETKNHLIAGRLNCVGRKSDSYNFERIGPSFWVGAKIDWGNDSVSRDDEVVVEVRVITETTVDHGSEEAESRTTREIVAAAIEHYATQDPTLSAPPSVRFRAYRAYIEKQGFDPFRDRGFSTKTFEACETEYRNNNK